MPRRSPHRTFASGRIESGPGARDPISRGDALWRQFVKAFATPKIEQRSREGSRHGHTVHGSRRPTGEFTRDRDGLVHWPKRDGKKFDG